DSLLRQTWPAVEIVLVDDGSDAASKHAITELATCEGGERISLQTHPFNQGLACARNTGVEAATGEWITFVDADDWVEPDFIEKLARRAQADSADVVCCRFAVSSAGSEESYLSDEGAPGLYDGTLADAPGLLNAATLSMNNKLFARSLFEDIRFPVYRDFEDLATCPRLLLRASRIALVEEALYHYIQRSADSLMSRYDTSYLQIVAALRTVQADFARQQVPAELQAALRELSCRELITDRLYPFLRFAPPAVARAFIDAALRYLDGQYPGWRRELRARHAFILRHKLLLRWYAAILRWSFA
ncbi:MAG: glycosyltransferase, partial [Actinomycetia bacterium]|nr:glycosyltransferase [Actinomycetes bacterium]